MIKKLWYPFLLIILLGIFLLWVWLEKFTWKDLSSNLLSEYAGILVTITVIDALNAWRIDQKEKESLILSFTSPNKLVATEAARVLRIKGWLTNGSIKDVLFQRTSLDQAELHQASLRNSIFLYTSLKGANINLADISNCTFTDTILENAHAHGTKFDGSIIIGETVKPENFFKNAEFIGASFRSVNFMGVRNDEITEDPSIFFLSASKMRNSIMPDGTKYDGRYQLAGDVSDAINLGFDPYDEESMRKFYEIA